MDDDRKSSLPPPSEIDAMCDDDKMPDEAETTPETSGARTETPEVGEPNAHMHERGEVVAARCAEPEDAAQ